MKKLKQTTYAIKNAINISLIYLIQVLNLYRLNTCFLLTEKFLCCNMFTKRERRKYMNIQENDIVNAMVHNSFTSQREVAEYTGYSLGTVNKSINKLMEKGYINEYFKITDKTRDMLKKKKVRNAIILAAGYGMRMVPINTETPKGLLEVGGETLIERIIKQLKEVGINDITVVVGFMKEQYEFLIDEYNVKLVVNVEYAIKNNLHSLAMVAEEISNSYIIPCDIWCRNNPFKDSELYSWYMVTDELSKESGIRINRKYELVKVSEKKSFGNKMIGICYVDGVEACVLKEKLKKYDELGEYEDSFWETVLYEGEKLLVSAKCASKDNVVEINTYEQLRELDENSSNLKIDAINIICKALNVDASMITNIRVMKKGMTNRSFIFTCRDKKYIMRIPGEGTDKLINREEEAMVYEAIHGKGICDNIIYINPKDGYKITEFMDNTRVCDAFNEEDVKKCMKKLRDFHNEKIVVGHHFDIFGQIELYESLWKGLPSVYRDYFKTKDNCMKLKTFIERQDIEECLTHIDAVPDNFLFDTNSENGDIKLIDWEYAGMQDPHVDLAMFSVYSFYDKEQVDRLIDIYFEGRCDKKTRAKIYCYVSICGLLWSNWCEYKRTLGVEFGEYSIKQYRYAKDFYKYATEFIDKIGE